MKIDENVKSKEGLSAPFQPFGKTIPYIAAVGSLLFIWQIVAWILPEFLMPDVSQGLKRFIDNFSDPDFLNGLQSSLYRLAWGYPIACLLGAVLGLLGGVSKTFSVYLKSVVSILQSIPPITWVPFFVVLIGFGNLPIIFVITIASFFPMALSVLNATEGVNRTHLELARVMGANTRQLITKVYGPETLPAFVTGAQVAFGNAWRSLIAAEMVGGASAGLGWSISYAGEIADMEGVLASIVTIGTIAIILDHVVLNGIKRKLLKWRYTGGDEK
ncbi:ABC transporter permease [Pseudalkalibacillus decolorationis]|uniref:ABC transporter permease n=1 Tax=Pseudalkalibacillus decolorationis TaxID=163879 RepID=UPI0021487207|nr:ABC transporter permease [Pseudalkalibacillus decolorationis]